MDGTRGIFRGKSAGCFHRRSEAADETQGFSDFFDLWRADRYVTGFFRRISTIGDERGNEAGKNGIDFPFRQSVDLDPCHAMLPELTRPAAYSEALGHILRS